MKNRKGEIATILTVGAVFVIGVTAIVSSLNLGKKQSTSSRANCIGCEVGEKCYVYGEKDKAGSICCAPKTNPKGCTWNWGTWNTAGTCTGCAPVTAACSGTTGSCVTSSRCNGGNTATVPAGGWTNCNAPNVCCKPGSVIASEPTAEEKKCTGKCVPSTDCSGAVSPVPYGGWSDCGAGSTCCVPAKVKGFVDPAVDTTTLPEPVCSNGGDIKSGIGDCGSVCTTGYAGGSPGTTFLASGARKCCCKAGPSAVADPVSQTKCASSPYKFGCCVNDNPGNTCGDGNQRWRWYGCTGQTCEATKINNTGAGGDGTLHACPASYGADGCYGANGKPVVPGAATQPEGPIQPLPGENTIPIDAPAVTQDNCVASGARPQIYCRGYCEANGKTAVNPGDYYFPQSNTIAFALNGKACVQVDPATRCPCTGGMCNPDDPNTEVRQCGDDPEKDCGAGQWIVNANQYYVKNNQVYGMTGATCSPSTSKDICGCQPATANLNTKCASTPITCNQHCFSKGGAGTTSLNNPGSTYFNGGNGIYFTYDGANCVQTNPANLCEPCSDPCTNGGQIVQCNAANVCGAGNYIVNSKSYVENNGKAYNNTGGGCSSLNGGNLLREYCECTQDIRINESLNTIVNGEQVTLECLDRPDAEGCCLVNDPASTTQTVLCPN